eukprot:jgi/Botrbrau1/20614/Bobra.113_1s0040.1
MQYAVPGMQYAVPGTQSLRAPPPPPGGAMKCMQCRLHSLSTLSTILYYSVCFKGRLMYNSHIWYSGYTVHLEVS